MIHAGETYTAMRLDSLARSLRRAQEAARKAEETLGSHDREATIAALREARDQSNETLARLEAQR